MSIPEIYIAYKAVLCLSPWTLEQGLAWQKEYGMTFWKCHTLVDFHTAFRVAFTTDIWGSKGGKALKGEKNDGV